MSIHVYRKLFFLSLLVLSAFLIKAQQPRFVYLQSDNAQLFYVKFNNKVISSSPQGYVILSGITEGKYPLIVGFPKNEFPEKRFDLDIEKNNEGFLLKNFNDKGWQLFNLQTLDLIAGNDNVPGGNEHKMDTAVAVKKDSDAFSSMLANVVKDSSILQNHQQQAVVQKEEVKVDSVKNMAEVVNPSHTDSSFVGKMNTVTSPAVGDSAQSMAEVVSPVHTDSSLVIKMDSVAAPSIPVTVRKILSEADKDGLQMVYQDKNESGTDTVRIFFPGKKEEIITDTAKVVATPNSNVEKPVAADSTLTITPTVANTLKKDTVVNVFTDSAATKSTANQNVITGSNPSPSSTAVVTQVFKIHTGDNAAQNEKNNIENEKDSLLLNNRADSQAVQPKQEIQQVNTDSVSTGEAGAPSLNKENNQKGKEENNEAKIVLLPKVITSSKVNSDCKDFATNEDFFKLRKKMAAENSRDDMLAVAKKYFKTKCFSTEQIKNLSYLFLTDEGKYQFFDEAYPFASDSDQYQMLESQFTDEYYLNRFKAMIRK